MIETVYVGGLLIALIGGVLIARIQPIAYDDDGNPAGPFGTGFNLLMGALLWPLVAAAAVLAAVVWLLGRAAGAKDAPAPLSADPGDTP